MTSDVRERIFERFFTTKAEGRGTGLGLAAVQRFVVESGGCLALHSQPDRGTTLAIVRFPRPRGFDVGATGSLPERCSRRPARPLDT